MQVLKILFICLEVVLLFNLLIVVHELGHYLAACWRGLVIDRFGIWFGKPIWKTKIGGVDFCLGSIPAGGYVALPQMAPMETIEGKNRNAADNLPPVSPLDKIIVAFAGPLFSFSLALAFAVLVWGVGRPVSEADATTVIGQYTVFGDMDLDGQVTPGDYGILDASLGSTPPLGVAWISGDADLDGSVTPGDYGILDANLGSSLNPPQAPATVVALDARRLPPDVLQS